MPAVQVLDWRVSLWLTRSREPAALESRTPSRCLRGRAQPLTLRRTAGAGKMPAVQVLEWRVSLWLTPCWSGLKARDPDFRASPWGACASDVLIASALHSASGRRPEPGVPMIQEQMERPWSSVRGRRRSCAPTRNRAHAGGRRPLAATGQARRAAPRTRLTMTVGSVREPAGMPAVRTRRRGGCGRTARRRPVLHPSFDTPRARSTMSSCISDHL